MPQIEYICSGCGLNKEDYVPGMGSTQNGLMIVGEAPGRNEVMQRQPFVGKAGRILNEALAIAGLNRNDIYITNLVKCRPPQNREPNQLEKSTCSMLLFDEIATVKPKVILSLGRHSTFFFFPSLKGQPMSSLHGTVSESTINHKGVGYHLSIIMAKHPATVFYSNLDINEYAKPFIKAYDILAGVPR